MKRRYGFFLCASFLVLSCAHGQRGSMAADRETIDRIRRETEAAENAGSTERMRVHVADDVVMMAPDMPPVSRAGPAMEAMGGFFSAFMVQIRYESHEIVVDGDLAFDRGTYRHTLTPRHGGPALQENGKYLWVYKRVPGGAWKQWRVIWNRNDPLPVAGSSS